MPTVHLIIKGKVQGVFYRATAKKKADENGITGWIKNTDEGHVEMVASGSQPALQQFIKWCEQGPTRANVSELKTTERDEEKHDEFVIKK